MIHLKQKALFNWSGGKDSSLCLYHALKDEQFDIQYLLTTLNGKYKRISMHGVSEDLLDKQVESINLPLRKIYLPEFPNMVEYESIISEALTTAKEKDIKLSIFGDIFLEDLRKYRENQLKKLGFKAIFPLWKRNTTEIAEEFISLGFKSIIVSVYSRYLDKSFAGRIYDESFLNDLPENVDPCGENGEFHSFVFDGPIFQNPILFDKGEVVYKEYKSDNKENPDKKFGFWYCDLI
ncbi:MAG: diphthine--ammonia ligase [Bacteroidales bacterium]|nr:diphthine--ammonia ligase [Bacteroidales bacterium]